VADLGIDREGATGGVKLSHRGCRGCAPSGGAGAEPPLGVWGQSPPEAEA